MLNRASQSLTAQGPLTEAIQSDRCTFGDNSPEAIAQRKLFDQIQNSPRMAAQRKALDVIHQSPRIVSQKKAVESMSHSPSVVAQQGQKRVTPPTQMKDGISVNDDQELKHEADDMANKQQTEERPALGKQMGVSFIGATLQRKVGFEFQMLNSTVGLLDKTTAPTDLTSTTPQSDHSDKKLGIKGTPKFVVDGMDWTKGANAEYATTAQYDDPITAEGDIQAISNHAVKNIKDDTISDFDTDTKLCVWKGDTQAQPQINVDVHFENVGKEEKVRKGKTQKMKNDPYIGIDYKSFKWNPGKTGEFIKSRQKVKAKIDEMYADLSFCKKSLINLIEDDPTTPKYTLTLDDKDYKQLLPPLKAAIMTYVSGRIPTKQTLGKDLPLLPKVDISELLAPMEQLLKKTLGSTCSIHGDRIKNIGDTVLKELSIKKLENNLEYDSNKAPTTISDVSPVSPDTTKSTLVMEYRRAKEVATGKWPEFAKQAVSDFNHLDTEK